MGGAGGNGVRERGIEYHPLPSQQRFHDSGARFKGFSGPIGSGKSQALCQEALKLTYLNPGRTGLLGAPTFPMLRDATQAALIDILERNRIPHEWNRAENSLLLRETRSRILFRAVEEFERLRGSNLAWFGLDELTYAPEEAWLRLEGRLRDPQGDAAVRVRGVDAEGLRLGLRAVRGIAGGRLRDGDGSRPFENRFLLERIPDYYERLKQQLRRAVLRAGGSGRVPGTDGGAGVFRVQPERQRGGGGDCGRGVRSCGRWILTWTRCLRWWRRWMAKR